jgi:hypothetical protein
MATATINTEYSSLNEFFYFKGTGVLLAAINPLTLVLDGCDVQIPAATAAMQRACHTQPSAISVTSHATGRVCVYEYSGRVNESMLLGYHEFKCVTECAAKTIRIYFNATDLRDERHHTHGSDCGCGKPAFVPVTLTNRNGQSVTTNCTNLEAATKLAGNEWIWLYVHRAVQQQERLEAAQRRSQETQPQGTTQNQLPGVDLAAALEKIAHLMFYAIGRGLKSPRIRAAYKDIRFQIYLSKNRNVCIKAADRKESGTEKAKWGKQRYIGCIVKGEFIPAPINDWNKSVRRELLPVEAEFIANLAGDTVAFLAQCGKDLGTCCYCNHALDHAESKEVGYGPICAKNWGLPWGKKGYEEKVVTWTELYQSPVTGPVLAGFVRAILADPSNQLTWDILNNDFLADHGHLPLNRVNPALLPRI